MVHGVAKSQTQLNDFTFTFHFHTLEKEMATHSSILAWRIPGTGEPGGLPSMGSHRFGHDWSDLAAAAAAALVDSYMHLKVYPRKEEEMMFALNWQWSQIFLVLGTDFVEDNFSMSQGWGIVSEWYKCIPFIVHLISNLMLLLIWQEVLVLSLEVGTPALKAKTMGNYKG